MRCLSRHEEFCCRSPPPFSTRRSPTARPIDTGKVRDIYDFGDRLLIVATDRISAFDYVLGSGIPDKGKVLTQISAFWFERTASIVPNHLSRHGPGRLPGRGSRRRRRCSPADRCWCGRPSRCRSNASRAATCRDRAGRTTSATGEVCGIRLPAGLARVGPPARADLYAGDQGAERTRHQHQRSRGRANSSAPDVLARVTRPDAAALRRRAPPTPNRAASSSPTPSSSSACCRRRRPDRDADRLILIDEVLTPDSSRFWPRDEYRPGGPQPSFDKQFVRDYLERIKWNKQPPVPSLPDDVVAEDAGEIRRGVPAPDRPRAVSAAPAHGASDDDQRSAREARRRHGRARACSSTTPCGSSRSASSPGCSGSATAAYEDRRRLGIHRNTLSRKMGDYKIKSRTQAAKRQCLRHCCTSLRSLAELPDI